MGNYKYAKERCNETLEGQALLLEIIRTKADCLFIEQRNCCTCPVYHKLRPKYPKDSGVCMGGTGSDNNSEERYKTAVEIFIKEYGKDELIKELI